MKLTKKGEYALRAMIALAQSADSMTINAVALRQNIPKKFLEQILLALKAAHLVTSRAGPKGGYELSQEPQYITVGMILNAVEEPFAQLKRPPRHDEYARVPTAIEALLREIRAYIRGKLEGLTLQALAAEDLPGDQMEALMYYI